MKTTVYYPTNGYDWNPLTKLGRNESCPCLSGKKYKKCCLPFMPQCLPSGVVKSMNKYPDIQDKFKVFYTWIKIQKENQAKVLTPQDEAVTGKTDLEVKEKLGVTA